MNAIVDTSNVVLETERLILRSWTINDLNDFYEYASVDGVGQMAGWYPHKSIDESKEILDMFLKEKNQLALWDKKSKKVIGSIGLEKISIDLGDKYSDLLGREIGYTIGKPYWGQGLMPEAVSRIIRYCFEEQKYDFLLVSHSKINIQSKRVIEKCGFHFLKEQSRKNLMGQVNDSIYYILEKTK